MSLPVVLREEAEVEFDEAFDHYEGRQAGLGVDFTTRVQQVFDRIAATPQLHAIVFADVRKAVVPRFPYSIFYRADDSRVEILAVFNNRRDPSICKAESNRPTSCSGSPVTIQPHVRNFGSG